MKVFLQNRKNFKSLTNYKTNQALDSQTDIY